MDNASGTSTSGCVTEEDKLVVLTTLGCPYCRKTKAALQSAGIGFKEVDLSTQLDALQQVKQQTGRSTVPQVFVDGCLVGGSTEISKLLDSGELKARLQTARKPALPENLSQLLQDRGTSSQGSLEAFVLPPGMQKEHYDLLRTYATRLFKSKGEGGALPAVAVAQFLRDQGAAEDEASAQTKVEEMVSAHLVAQLGDGYVLVADAIRDSTRAAPLNAAFKWQRESRPASQVAEGLRQVILGLFDRHLSADGRAVKYKALAQDPDFLIFVTATAELQGVDPTPLSREERVAFFLNIYNVLIVHAQAALGGPSNLLARLRWFSSIKYKIGELEYSADDIEHGILRGNKPAASSLPVLLGHPEWSKGFFKEGDPRLQQAVKDMDKRIHFALNCGAKSCPPIKVYTPGTLEEGLQSATTAFCEGEVHVVAGERIVRLSKIFKWYSMDFGPKEELLTWLLEYLPEEPSGALRGLLEEEGSDRIKLKYKEYDWGLNED